MIEESGPWLVRNNNEGTYIESDDTTYGVRLRVNGDFKSHEQRVEYAEEIALRLSVRDTMFAKWKTLESCPDKETVLFFCGEYMQVGRMEHSVTRLDGTKRDCFWGWFGADENPPTHWIPLPATPNVEHQGLPKAVPLDGPVGPETECEK